MANLTEIFTFGKACKPEVLIMLPRKICHKEALTFLTSKVMLNLNISQAANRIAFCGIPVPEKGTLKKADFEAVMAEVTDYCEVNGVEILAVGAAKYYEKLTGSKKYTYGIGKVYDGINDFADYKIVPILNPVMVNIVPSKITILKRGFNALSALVDGEYIDDNTALDLTTNEIITDVSTATKFLKSVYKKEALWVDIETTGLDWSRERILTVSFGWGEKDAFCIALHPQYHSEEVYTELKDVLRSWFKAWRGNYIGHNWILFDQAFIVHEIMNDFDFEVNCVDVVNLFDMDDTMLMAYIIENSTERPSIGLKELSFHIMGEYDWDVDVKNLIEAPLEKVATYNNYDCIATWHIYQKYKALLISEGLYPLYERYKKVAKQLLKMKMHGLFINPDKTDDAHVVLTELHTDLYAHLILEDGVEDCVYETRVKKAEKDNATRKAKAKNPSKIKIKTHEDFADVQFNTNSYRNKQTLFYDVYEFPVIAKSKDTGEPSTGKEVVQELITYHADTAEQKRVLQTILDIVAADKINSTYITTFQEKGITRTEGTSIYGNFKLTGTITGRLSSDIINFQNMPSGSKYGKMVKGIFEAPDGWVFAGADYAALEDRIIAIEAECPAKLRIFTDGIDGHSLNAANYFADELEERGIVIDFKDPDSVNAMKLIAADLRQDGKSVTFGMSYGASPAKVASQLKVSIKEGQKIWDRYWELYKEIKWYNAKAVQEAQRTGYVTSECTGLRLKVPFLNSKDEYRQEKEKRVIGNFKIQSFNFLTLEALDRMQDWIEQENLQERVLIVNQIHDAIYFLIRNDSELIKRVNDRLIEVMCIPYKPDMPIQLEAELDVGFSWEKMVTLPNNCSVERIDELVDDALAKFEGREEVEEEVLESEDDELIDMLLHKDVDTYLLEEDTNG